MTEQRHEKQLHVDLSIKVTGHLSERADTRELNEVTEAILHGARQAYRDWVTANLLPEHPATLSRDIALRSTARGPNRRRRKVADPQPLTSTGEQKSS
jgi:hypothetical protein